MVAMNILLLTGFLFLLTIANSARDDTYAAPHSIGLETLTAERAQTTHFQMGTCVPVSFRSWGQFQCSLEEDYESLAPLKKASFAPESEDARIEEEKPAYKYNASVRALLVVCGLLVVAAVLGSVVDAVLQSTGQAGTKDHGLLSHLLNFLTAFSLFKNVRAIMTTQEPPSTISSLNGIRVMSMFWVLFYHADIWNTVFNPLSNLEDVERDILPRLWYQVVLNGSFAVDSFFLLSGTVAAYNNFRAMEKNERNRFPFFNYYVHRYLRLTMVYAFVTLSSQQLTGPDSWSYKNCDQYWWTNLAYINNLYPWKVIDECTPWTWTMANDMQFYVIAPLFLIPFYRSYRKGLTVIGVLLIMSFIVTGTITAINDFSAVSTLQMYKPDAAHMQNELYIKPYCRIPPYLVGSILGYILHNRVQLPFQGAKKNLCYVAMWTVAVVTFAAIIFGLYGTWYGYKTSMTENILFYTFTRFAWGVGVALVVFACHNGYGWIINDFLSMKIWIPLSRLTYIVSLIHPIILTIIVVSGKQVSTHWDANLVICAFAAIVLSYSAAGVLAVLIEYPLSHVEVLVFKMIGIHQEESVRLVNPATQVRIMKKNNE